MKKTTASEMDVIADGLLVRVEEEQDRDEHEATAGADERAVRADDEAEQDEQEFGPGQGACGLAMRREQTLSRHRRGAGGAGGMQSEGMGVGGTP